MWRQKTKVIYDVKHRNKLLMLFLRVHRIARYPAGRFYNYTSYSNSKENCNYCVRSGRNSPISSISGSTVAGDKIPIKSTHAALVWGSVKPSKSDTKEFTIRNISDNRIKLQVQISDKNNNFLVSINRTIVLF